MKTAFLLPALLAALSLAAALPATAQQKLLPAQSELAFNARQMGVPISGYFKKFEAQVSFDAAKLAAPEMDSELPKAAWFNAPKFPQATFTSSAFKALGAGKYEVAGKLTVKGQARDVLVPLSMVQTGAVTVASGVLPIKRLAYQIGDGEWADTAMVADEVQVRFKFALSGVGKL